MINQAIKYFFLTLKRKDVRFFVRYNLYLKEHNMIQ